MYLIAFIVLALIVIGLIKPILKGVGYVIGVTLGLLAKFVLLFMPATRRKIAADTDPAGTPTP